MSKNVIEVTKMYGKGKITVPAKIRKILELKDGNRVYFIEDEQGKVFLEKAPPLKSERVGKYK